MKTHTQRQTSRQTNRHTDRRRDRQTERETDGERLLVGCGEGGVRAAERDNRCGSEVTSSYSPSTVRHSRAVIRRAHLQLRRDCSVHSSGNARVQHVQSRVNAVLRGRQRHRATRSYTLARLPSIEDRRPSDRVTCSTCQP